MDWYERIKSYYERGLWDAKRVDDAVTKDAITWLQAEQIKSAGSQRGR